MNKIKYNFINPNTDDEMIKYLPKIIAKTIMDNLTIENIDIDVFLHKELYNRRHNTDMNTLLAIGK